MSHTHVDWVPLREVGTWYGGGTPSKSVPRFWSPKDHPWLSPKDMVADTLKGTEDHVADAALESRTIRLVPAGSVAFVVRSNVLRRRLPVAFVPFAVTLNQDMRAVVPDGGVLVEYLGHVCRAKASEILSIAGRTDGSMAAIQSRSLLDFKIPVPDLVTQRRLVAILDEQSALYAELESRLQAEVRARHLQFAHYRDALLTFSGRVKFRRAPMSELGAFQRGRRFTKADVVAIGIPSIHYGEIYTDYGVSATSAVTQVNPRLAPSLRYAEPGEVIMAGVGETVEDVGKAVAWLGHDKVAIHDDCFSFRSKLNPAFVSYAMQTADFHRQKAQFVSRAKVKRLSADGLGKIRIPVPSREEQDRIVETLDAFDALVNDLSVGLPAELKARRAQYEYYRDRLLTFPEASSRGRPT